MNLAQVLSEAAQRDPEQIALRLDDFALNYGLLEQAAMRIAGMLRDRGVTTGDRVALMLPNVPHFVAAYYGILRSGAIVVPLNVLNRRREIEYYLRDSGAKLLFVWHDFAGEAAPAAAATGCECISGVPGEFEQTLLQTDACEQLVERAPSDTAVLLYTSGTTGTPKGAELTHENLLSNCRASRDLFNLDTGVVVLGALPLFHSFGQTCAMNACVVAAGMLTLLPRFDPAKALAIIERDRVAVFEGVPSMYGAMLNAADHERHDTSTLRCCASGGAAMPVELMRGFEQAFNCQILEGYGLSETSPVASFNHPDRERKPGSIGQPIAGVEMRVVDDHDRELASGEVGEIVVRGHNVMKGYWNRPEATTEAMRGGWFHTGDLGRIDAEGYFFIVDRKKDMIIRKGFNVYPREIEEVLYEHPAVREAAVLGIPDDELGEEVGAAVALKQGATATADELRSFVKEQVAAFKYPRRVWIVDELPKGPTGKILKREIELPGGAVSAAEVSAAVVSVRRASAGDVDLIYTLIVALAEYEQAPDQVVGTPEQLRHGLFGDTPAAEALIGEVDGEPVGFALFHGSFSTWECQPGIWLEDLFVLPEHRRSGVGGQLLSHVARVAVERGCTRLGWTALDWNEMALSFYRKIGATVLDEWTNQRLSGAALQAVAERVAADE